MITALQGWVGAIHVATPFLIRAAMAGSDAVAIDTEFENPFYSLLAKPDVKTEGLELGVFRRPMRLPIDIADRSYWRV